MPRMGRIECGGRGMEAGAEATAEPVVELRSFLSG